jgi:hypothetical protein
MVNLLSRAPTPANRYNSEHSSVEFLRSMKITTILVWLAILAYVGSYFLTAVKDATASPRAAGYPGYFCAYITLTSPWGSSGVNELRQDPVDFFSVLFSGWINPLFLIALIVRWRRPHGRLGWILGALLLILFPACWVVFFKAHLRPSTGYFLWSAAIVVALFSTAFARSRPDRAFGRPA